MIFVVSILEADWPRGKQVPWVPFHLQFAKHSVGYRLLCKHSDRSLKWLLSAYNTNILQSLVLFPSCPLPACLSVTLLYMSLHCPVTEGILTATVLFRYLIQSTPCTNVYTHSFCSLHIVYMCKSSSDRAINYRKHWPLLTKNKCCPSRMLTQSFA
jgi:hypothetical protein